jgi:hypothetical protein
VVDEDVRVEAAPEGIARADQARFADANAAADAPLVEEDLVVGDFEIIGIPLTRMPPPASVAPVMVKPSRSRVKPGGSPKTLACVRRRAMGERALSAGDRARRAVPGRGLSSVKGASPPGARGGSTIVRRL